MGIIGHCRPVQVPAVWPVADHRAHSDLISIGLVEVEHNFILTSTWDHRKPIVPNRISSINMPAIDWNIVHPSNNPQFAHFPSRRSTVFSTKGLVASSQALASQAGLEILNKGGNAGMSSSQFEDVAESADCLRWSNSRCCCSYR